MPISISLADTEDSDIFMHFHNFNLVFVHYTKQFNDMDTIIFLVFSMLWESTALQREKKCYSRKLNNPHFKRKENTENLKSKKQVHITSKCCFRGSNQYTDTVYILQYNMHSQND